MKKVSESFTTNYHLLLNEDINGTGRLYGGRLLEWIDEMAGIVAMRHAGPPVTTAAIDNLQFKKAAFLNDIVVMTGKITHTGHTSMEIRVDTYVEKPDGMRYPINRAYLTVVAIDEDGHARPVPKLIVESESEIAEWEGAEKRIKNRKLRRKDGF